MKRCSPLLITTETQIKTMIPPNTSQNGHHKSLHTVNVGEDVEKRELLHRW